MKQYKELVAHVLDNGRMRGNRTDKKALSVFGGEFQHEISDGFPLLTSKTVNIDAVLAELVGFIRGVTSAADFRKLGTKIWDANANQTMSWVRNAHRKGEDDLGHIYGHQWRRWDSVKVIDNNDMHSSLRVADYMKDGYAPLYDAGLLKSNTWVLRKSIDQLQQLVDGLKRDPTGRRHIVSAWNPADMNEMALPPCHAFFQCYVDEDGYLDLKMYQRSADLFLGVPFNIASYAALLVVLARLTGYDPGNLTLTFGDLHIYEDHIPQCKELLTRYPKPLPYMEVDRISSLDEVTTDIFRLSGYNPHPPLPGKMAI